MSNAVCAACKHPIDAAAKVCPYCGGNPVTGEKAVDTQAVLQEIFKPREVTTSESVIEYARQRQGIVVALGVIVAFLILAGLHQLVTSRNATATNEPAVALTEVADLSNQTDETKPLPMPDLQFQTDGRPQVMQTFIVEQGAVTPPEVIAAQQAAAAEAAQKQANAQGNAATQTAPQQQPAPAAVPKQQPPPPQH
ncbi:MAG: hypothetical protein ACXVIJ_10585 [Thermoanaerobaculia bacterium]